MLVTGSITSRYDSPIDWNGASGGGYVDPWKYPVITESPVIEVTEFEWECIYCETTNQPEIGRCDGCGSPKGRSIKAQMPGFILDAPDMQDIMHAKAVAQANWAGVTRVL